MLAINPYIRPSVVDTKILLLQGTNLDVIGEYNAIDKYDFVEFTYGGNLMWRLVRRSAVSRTLNYEILANQSTSLSTARSLMGPVETAFKDKFGIILMRQGNGSQTSSLNVKSGCTMGNDICNTTSHTISGECGIASDCKNRHHKSSLHFLEVNPSSGTTAVFRFVDYNMCYYSSSLGHIGVGGVTDYIGGNNIIVSTASEDTKAVIAHEISHLFGAMDPPYTSCNDICIMNGTAGDNIIWCKRHENEINAFIS